MMENKKVSIMTWYTYDNYGSVLQAYALRQTIKEIGYKNVDMVNYLPKSQRIRLIKRINKKNIKRKLLLRKEKTRNLLNQKQEKFNRFRENNLTLTKICNDSTELFLLNDEYDKFICGSDQIWAPTVFDENYFLSFVSNNSKKISYAPSIGLPSIDNIYIKKKIQELISQFESISIREEQGKEIIQQFTNKDVQVVLDPTLLLNKLEWNERFDLESKEKDYIVFYCLGTNEKHYEIAKRIAKKLGKELKVIPGDVLDYKKQGVVNASPEEFLKLIYNAYMVITDSFHGTIFSINFNVPFITFRRFKDNKLSQNSRIYNILKKVNLEDRIYNNNDEYFLKNINIDFSKCNKILEKERKESIEFLEKSLDKEVEEKISTKITNICTGCGMCAAICPKKCINIKLNDNGFYEYEIDEEKCIKCNKCKRVCGQLNTKIDDMNKMKMYSAYSLDENVLKQSSSGGIAYELSLQGIKKGLPVIGCTYDVKDAIAKHIVVKEEKDLTKLSGSKYIQSYTLEAFNKLEELEQGIVIGTPCQITSVDRYLKSVNKRDNFLLIDLICHGVPSYYLWKKYIKPFGEIKEVKFRDKKYGWRSMVMSINLEYHKCEDKDLFYDAFRTEIVYNKSCYNCKYRTKTNADIRIGDYWGPKFKKEQNGVSMVIARTERGKKELERLVEDNKIKMEKQDIMDYFKIQQTENIAIPLLYEQMIAELKNDNISLKEISKKYCKSELRYNNIVKIILDIYSKLKGK